MLRALFLILLSFLVAIQTAVAETGPGERVSQAVNQIKQAGNTIPIVEFVHWPTVFAGLTDTQKQDIGATTPEELKNFYKKFLDDPATMFINKMEASKAKLPQDQQQAMDQQISQYATLMRQKLAEANEKLKTAQYEVGEVNTDGDKATVVLKSIIDGKENSEKLNLVRVDGQWYFPSLMLAERKPQQTQQEAPTDNIPAVAKQKTSKK